MDDLFPIFSSSALVWPHSILRASYGQWSPHVMLHSEIGLLLPSFTFKDSCGYIGPTEVIQNNPLSRSPFCYVTWSQVCSYSQVLGVRTRTSFGELLFCLPHGCLGKTRNCSKRARRSFWSGGSVLYLEHSGGYTGIYSSQNLPSVTAFFSSAFILLIC